VKGLKEIQMVDDNKNPLDEAQGLMMELERDPAHCVHVLNLSTQLYDQLTLLHNYGPEERRFLECAALLHDIGWSIGEKQHHKHSMRLILSTPLPSMSDREKRIIANVARYHRRAIPKLKHSEYAWLAWEDQQVVCRLSALLRLADALDRSHERRVQQIECLLSDHICILSLAGKRPLTEELEAVERKKGLFTETYAMDLRVEGETTMKNGMALSLM